MDPGDQVIVHIGGDGDQRPRLIAAQTVTTCLALIAVGARFWARKLSKTPVSWDDWIMIPALIFAFAFYGLMWWWMAYGFGRPMGDVTFNKLRMALIICFTSQIVYPLSIACSKFGILLLYRRIFTSAGQRWIKWYLISLNIAVVLWLAGTIITACLQCQPIDRTWDRLVPGECNVQTRSFFLAVGITNMLTDVLMVGLPIVLCARLQLKSLLSKVLICAVFALGLFTTVVSGVRLHFIIQWVIYTDGIQQLNLTWNYVDNGLWSATEINMAIVSACLPCLKPLVASAIPDRWVPDSLKKRGSKKKKKNKKPGVAVMNSAATIGSGGGALSPTSPAAGSRVRWSDYGGTEKVRKSAIDIYEIEFDDDEFDEKHADLERGLSRTPECSSLQDSGGITVYEQPDESQGST